MKSFKNFVERFGKQTENKTLNKSHLYIRARLKTRVGGVGTVLQFDL